jgi:ethanolamine utilization cobalamin adenosyltransferase
MNAVSATRLTIHAKQMLERRSIKLEWVEETLRMPTSERADQRDPTLTLAFRQIPEMRDKWLRVVYRKENDHSRVVVTAFFDRNQEIKL